MEIVRMVVDVVSIAILVAMIIKDERMYGGMESSPEFVDTEIDEPQIVTELSSSVVYI